MKAIRPIRNDDDLACAIAEVTPYFEVPPAPGSEEADRFDILSDLIEAYENRLHPIPAPDPIELVRAHMEASGRTQTDLAALLGSRSRASEILARKRPLTVEMIRRLSGEWGLPASNLLVPYRLAA
jgi:HTH-type transcriptional regulator/antitoxin HigA